MKKIIFTLITICFVSVFANDFNDQEMQLLEKSEKEMKKNSVAEMSKLELISKIVTADESKKTKLINTISSFSDSEMKEIGFSQQNIEKFRNAVRAGDQEAATETLTWVLIGSIVVSTIVTVVIIATL